MKFTIKSEEKRYMYKYDVSIIVPVYNTEKYIEECVQSIMKQNYDVSKLQIILINDGSKDGSRAICETLSKKHANILLINQENAGVSEARNVGIQKAEGKYILFLDSDDKLEEQSIKKLVEFFDKHYDEIDLVTYPMIVYANEEAKPKQHYRYRFYKEGTGVYDLIENPYLGQSTINTMIKNRKEQNILFDKGMTYSEDEAFNTEILMQKKKIGFCEEATYIYRKQVGSVTKNRSNPYYTFESLTGYNEKLIEKYQDENGKIPTYIQAIILNNLRWRIKTDEIFPYHYEGEEFKKAINRITTILNYIENGTILNMPSMSIYHKFYIFKLKGMKLQAYYGDHIFSIMNDNEVLFSSEDMEIGFTRFKIVDNQQAYILGCVKSPLCEMIKPRLFIKYKTKGQEVKEKEILLQDSMKSYYKSTIKTNTFYQFEERINLDEVERFEFYLIVNQTRLAAQYHFSDTGILNTALERYTVLTQDKKHVIKYDEEENLFYIKTPSKKEIREVQRDNRKLYQSINPKINIYRYIALLNQRKNIWLYYDSRNVYDNGYYQFLHDISKKDGVQRYYIYDGDEQEVKKKFTPEQRKHLLKFGTLKHKIYFLRAKKIIASDISLSVYCPFKKSIRWYRDFANYELIYLQHGILYANLLKMYAKEFAPIDKIVISSEFEKKNLIQNYKYQEKDLIPAGMPRFDVEGNKPLEKHEGKRIIYAPSWRKYLVGELIGRSRKANMLEMKNSNFYKKNVEVLTSERLKKILKENQVTLEFKLHPNFECYRRLFEEKCSENIILGEKEVSPNHYDMLITDYSSFQFDFIKHQIPITYFVPDKEEFSAGLHTYRKLDLPLEEAFGDVVYTAKELIDRIENYIQNDFAVEEKYKKRMEGFFYQTENCCERIYEALSNKEGK